MPKRRLIFLTLVQVENRHRYHPPLTKETPANQVELLTLADLGSLEVFFPIDALEQQQ